MGDKKDKAKSNASNEQGFKYRELKALDNENVDLMKEEDEELELKPAAYMYGEPAKMISKSHPLYKKGKLTVSYNK